MSVTVFEGETTDAGTGASTGGTATPGGGDGTGSEVGIGAAGPGFGPLAALAGVLLLALSRRFERVE